MGQYEVQEVQKTVINNQNHKIGKKADPENEKTFLIIRGWVHVRSEIAIGHFQCCLNTQNYYAVEYGQISRLFLHAVTLDTFTSDQKII